VSAGGWRAPSQRTWRPHGRRQGVGQRDRKHAGNRRLRSSGRRQLDEFGRRLRRMRASTRIDGGFDPGQAHLVGRAARDPVIDVRGGDNAAVLRRGVSVEARPDPGGPGARRGPRRSYDDCSYVHLNTQSVCPIPRRVNRAPLHLQLPAGSIPKFHHL